MKLLFSLYITCLTCYVVSEKIDTDILGGGRIPSEFFKRESGDWFSLEYGKGKDLLRREFVNMMDSSDPKNPQFIVVGILNVPKEGQTHVYSYIGDEKGIKVIGVKDNEKIAQIDPIRYAGLFGWMPPPNTFIHF